MRVAAGAVAKKYLKERYQVSIRGYLSALGPIRPNSFSWDPVEDNPFFWPDAAMVPGSRPTWTACARRATRSGRGDGDRDRRAAGLGEPIFDRLDADIAHALMSINAVKGVEIGAGSRASGRRAPSTATR